MALHTAWAATVVLVIGVVTADLCTFPQYHPTRVSIMNTTSEQGVFVQTPYRSNDVIKYTNWTKLPIHAFGYSPVPAGWSLALPPNGDFYTSQYDYLWKRDIAMMRKMNVTLIRVWNWNFMGSGSHREFLDELFNGGENSIFILVPFMMGTVNAEGQVNYQDLSLIDTRQKVIEDWTVFVQTVSQHPAVLGFLVGNELEKTVYAKQMPDFFSLLNLMIEVSHQIESTTPDLKNDNLNFSSKEYFYHPITSPYAADTFKTFYTNFFDFLNVDFWALQSYNDNDALEFTILEYKWFLQNSSLFGKDVSRPYRPMLLTERGFSARTNYNVTGKSYSRYDEAHQADMLMGTLDIIEQLEDACIGVVIMEWNDEWWKGDISDVRAPGCPDPFADIHSNCATIISTINNASYANITMVFEEWLGVTSQEPPSKQSLARRLIDLEPLSYIFEFLWPTKTFCIKPRMAMWNLTRRWTNQSVAENYDEVCGTPTVMTQFVENPVVLVLLPCGVVLAVSIVIATMKCGVRKVDSNQEKVKRLVHIQDALGTSSAFSYRPLSEETQELLPQATMVAFSAAAIRTRAQVGHRRHAHQMRTPLDPHMKHLTQLIFDKVDCLSLEDGEASAKKYIDDLVKSSFSKELLMCSELRERFGVVQSAPATQTARGETTSPSTSEPSHVRNSSFDSNNSKSSVPDYATITNERLRVHEALHVVWFRYTEGYRLWQKRMKMEPLKRLNGDNPECANKMIEELVLLVLLRCTAGTLNHSPELMMRLYHEILSKRGLESERRNLWEKILRKDDGVFARLYTALCSLDPIMSLDDFNALGLDPDMNVDKLIDKDTNLLVKTFPERGGLHVLCTNYAWLIRLFLWLWILAWYLQPVHFTTPLCVTDATRYLAMYDALLYGLKSLGVVSMVYNSPMKFELVYSAIMAGVHLLLFVVFFATKDIMNMKLLYGVDFTLETIYLIVWFIAALIHEVYLFTHMAFGEHRMAGTFAEGHGQPRLMFGVAFSVGVLLSVMITFFLTQGGNENTTTTSATTVGGYQFALLFPFLFLVIFVAGVAPFISNFVGRRMNDRRSVIDFAPTAFWVAFSVICAVINIYWLVPSVINLDFAICKCQLEEIGVSTAVCNWRNTFACEIAVLFTWVATFFVSFVVGYAAFIGMSLGSGIAVAKVNQIGSVRNWEDVAMFGDKIIKHNMRYLTSAAEDFEVAKVLWNAFVDSMFKEHLLTSQERDNYMYQTISRRVFFSVADYFSMKKNQIGEGDDSKLTELMVKVLKELDCGFSDTLQSIKQILLPPGLLEAEVEERKVLYHRISMALTADDTCAFTTMPKRTQETARHLLAEHAKKDGVPLSKNLPFFLNNAWEETSAEEAEKTPGFIVQVFLRSRDVDFDVPPRNGEAIRRIVHFLWSLDCARQDTVRREKNEKDPAHAQQMLMRKFHRVATMPSCTTIIPYYNENVVYTWKELTEAFEKGQPRISFLEYLACQFPDEWENLAHNEVWREGLKPFDRGCVGANCRCGPLFLEYLLRSKNISEEQKWRISMFSTFRGQTLGRTLRGLESLRHGMKVLAMMEERHTFEAEYDAKRKREKEKGKEGESTEAEECLRHKHCTGQVQQLVDSKYQVIVAAQVYTPIHLREKYGVKGDQLARDQQLDRLQREGVKAFTFDIVCNDDKSSTSYFVPFNAPDATYSIKRPGLLRVSGKVPTEGKPENQLHAVPFAFGEVLNTFDMNQDDTLEMGYKHPLLVSIFWNPRPKVFTPGNTDDLANTPKYRIVGFAEHTYTRPLSLVGELMGAAEFCFVTITQRVLSRPLGVRAHYGHPDYVDGYWARTRGGMSKASHVVNVNEDIFAGYEMLARGQKITFVEWMQAQKGRESAFLPAFVFEAKLAGGAGQQVRSRDVFFLNRNLDIFSRMSVAFGTLGFYIVNFLMGASIHYFVWAIVLFRVSNTTFHQLGIMQAKIAVAWVFQLGYVLAIPLFVENCVEHGLKRGCIMFLRTIGPSIFFFVFHLQTKFHYFLESIIRGKAEYQATGRGFVLDRLPLAAVYKSYADSHIHEAFLYLIMLLIYRYVSDESTFSYLLRCLTLIFIVISWFCAPVFFQPYPTSHQLDIDWGQAKLWLEMPCRALNSDTRTKVENIEGETSWAAWYVLNQTKNWKNEESAYSFGHIFALTFVRLIATYLPWFAMFLLYVQQDTMYLVIAIFVGQVLHYVLVQRVDPTQHHYLSVIELVMISLAVPCALYYYLSLASVSFMDVAFGTCIYIVAASFLIDFIVLALRLKYTIKFRNGDEKTMDRQRLNVSMTIAPYKQINATLCMLILYLVTFIMSFFKGIVTSLNYSTAASFAWERVNILPREISVITAEPIDRKK